MDIDVLTPQPKVHKKKHSKTVSHKTDSNSEDSHHEKKSKKRDKEEKKHKKEKKEKKEKKHVTFVEPEPILNNKKRKAEEISKKAPSSDTKVAKWLTQLSIPFDAHKLDRLRRQQERNYNELVEIMSDASLKGLIYDYTVKTPVGRIFWYATKEDKFKSVHAEYNLIKLRDFAKESTLNVAELQKGLNETQRKTALACLAKTEADIVSPENWLYALIETGVVEKALQKPLSPTPAESILFHNAATKESYWMNSVKGKKELSLAIVTRTRTITETNMKNELASLAKKRQDIMHLIKKLGCTSGRDSTTVSMKADKTEKKEKSVKKKIAEIEPPKKKKKVEKVQKEEPRVMEIEGPPLKPILTPAQKLKAEIAQLPSVKALLESSDSDVTSSTGISSSDSSESEETKADRRMEAKLKAKVLEKQKNGTYRGASDPYATTPISKSIEIKKNIEEAKRHKKMLDEISDPEIQYFRTHCQ